MMILTNQYKKFLNLLVQLWKLTGKETHSGVEHDAQIELILWYILSFGGDVFSVAHLSNFAFFCVCVAISDLMASTTLPAYAWYILLVVLSSFILPCCLIFLFFLFFDTLH